MSRYTSQSTSGYNSSPPSDDGTESAANQVKWATIKTKLADVLKTFGEAINTQIQTMDGYIYPSGVTTSATNLTLVAGTHNGKNVRVSGSSTITLPEAASATTTFRVVITKTDATNTVTIDTQNSETIDGAASITLTSLGEAVGVVTDGSNWFVDARYFANQPLPYNYIAGLAVTVNGSDTEHDIDIAVGEARDTADSVNITLSSAITKQINAAWAEGTNMGGFPSGLTSGAVQASTTYRIFAIVDDAGTVDAGFDTSSTATNLLADATDYVGYREIGTLTTDASANIDTIWMRDGIPGSASPITTTSGTVQTFLGVPSWVTEITLTGLGLSVNGTEELLLQIGDSGGLENASYDGKLQNGATRVNHSTGWQLVAGGAGTDTLDFTAILTLVDSDNNRWGVTSTLIQTSSGSVHFATGTKALSATLDRVGLTTTNTPDTFDAGTLYLSYR